PHPSCVSHSSGGTVPVPNNERNGRDCLDAFGHCRQKIGFIRSAKLLRRFLGPASKGMSEDAAERVLNSPSLVLSTRKQDRDSRGVRSQKGACPPIRSRGVPFDRRAGRRAHLPFAWRLRTRGCSRSLLLCPPMCAR